MNTLLLFIFAIILWQVLHKLGRLTREKSVCRNCGTVARSITLSPRSLFLEILLWFSGLIPGVVYTLWCNHQTHRACEKCRSRDIVPLDSPAGRKLAGATPTDATPISEQLRP